MPNPSLSSFVAPTAYNKLPTQSLPFVTGFIPGVNGGQTYYNYSAPIFSGDAGAASNDPGGLFGWLLYARYLNGSGATTDTYIEYINSRSLVSDLNLLGGGFKVVNGVVTAFSGTTYALVSTPSQGGTYGFFLNTNNIVSGKTYGNDFLLALDYLAYGSPLVIAGTTAGLNDYQLENNTTIDALIGSTANPVLCSWLQNNPYAFGIFPTIPDSTGQIGAGNTMANYTSFVGATLASSGSTFSTRIINVRGVKGFYEVSTESLVPNTSITQYFLPSVADVAGFMSKAKNSNTLYTSPAGSENAVPLNGMVLNGVEWTNDSLKTILTNNRVNYFLNYINTFLGKDLVGATANSSASTSLDRIGPNSLKIQIQKDVSDIALKYLFTINNASTRGLVLTDVQSYLNKLTTFIDPASTQIVCDETNGNVDNTNALYITVIVKPIASVDTFTVNVSLVA